MTCSRSGYGQTARKKRARSHNAKLHRSAKYARHSPGFQPGVAYGTWLKRGDTRRVESKPRLSDNPAVIHANLRSWGVEGGGCIHGPVQGAWHRTRAASLCKQTALGHKSDWPIFLAGLRLQGEPPPPNTPTLAPAPPPPAPAPPPPPDMSATAVSLFDPGVVRCLEFDVRGAPSA